MTTPKSVQTFHQHPDRYLSPPILKDSFKAIYPILEKHNAKTVLDIGCASGDFLHFLPSSMQGVGVDMAHDLIEKAKEKNAGKSNLRFIDGDILAPKVFNELKGRFDAVTMNGMLHTFHDFKPLLDQVLLLKPKVMVIHSPFNDDPIDTWFFHKDLTKNETKYESAFNVFSKKTMSEYFHDKSLSHYEFVPFQMETTLKKDPNNPMYVYHVTLDNGEKYSMNGMGIIFKEYLLVVESH